jgi:hypothetical protein
MLRPQSLAAHRLGFLIDIEHCTAATQLVAITV